VIKIVKKIQAKEENWQKEFIDNFAHSYDDFLPSYITKTKMIAFIQKTIDQAVTQAQKEDEKELIRQRIYWQKRVTQKVREALEKNIIRFEILLGRFQACENDHPDTHKVSLREIPAWIKEQHAALAKRKEAV
jgi:hypothetical protein